MNDEGSAEKILALGRLLLLVLEVRSVELILACFWALLAFGFLSHLFKSLLLHQFLIQASICVIELLLCISRNLLRYFWVLFLGDGSEVMDELYDLHLLHFHAVHVFDLLLADLGLLFLGLLD